jgi:hypothetical protein
MLVRPRVSGARALSEFCPDSRPGRILPLVMRSLARRDCLRLVGATALAGLAAACQSTATPSAPPAPTAAPGGPPPLGLVLASSELVVGPNRFLLAILDNGRPVANASVRFEFFTIEGQEATKRSEAAAQYRAPAGEGKGIYVARTAFDRPGAWGVQVRAERRDGGPLLARTNFQVASQASAPMIGARAIASRNPTRHAAALAELCSAQPPCDMHELNIADALTLQRPLMISFATPGFCTSQTCAPVHGEVAKVKARRAAQAEFVHVEIYKDPRNLVVADTVGEWRLPSEPWIFVVNRDGVIADRLEGVTDAEELEAALSPVL